jgi:uncharacterized protein
VGPSKAAENRRKHGVDFLDAVPAVNDPHRLELVDDREDYGEQRLVIIGMSRTRVLFVVVTLRDDDESCRIISARRATRDEEDQYYAGGREDW